MTEKQTIQSICQLTVADVQFIKQTLSDLSSGLWRREENVMLLEPLRDFEECLRRLAEAFSPCERCAQPARNEGRVLSEEEVRLTTQAWQDVRGAYLRVRDVSAGSPPSRPFEKFIDKLEQAHKNLDRAISDMALSAIPAEVTNFGRALAELMGRVSGELTRSIQGRAREPEVRR